MKFLILFAFITSAWAQDTVKVIDHVNYFNYQSGEYLVHFEVLGKLKFPKGFHALPCFENAWKSSMEVVLVVDEHHGEIEECLLYEGVPGAYPMLPDRIFKGVQEPKPKM
jgi:hypothetical protein